MEMGQESAKDSLAESEMPLYCADLAQSDLIPSNYSLLPYTQLTSNIYPNRLGP